MFFDLPLKSTSRKTLTYLAIVEEGVVGGSSCLLRFELSLFIRFMMSLLNKPLSQPSLINPIILPSLVFQTQPDFNFISSNTSRPQLLIFSLGVLEVVSLLNVLRNSYTFGLQASSINFQTKNYSVEIDF